MPKTVGVAVSNATFHFDKLYTYAVMPDQQEAVRLGSMVLVPFGRGSKARMGVVLACDEEPEHAKLKYLFDVAPASACLTPELLRLVHFLKERTFCTYYEAVKAVIPYGAQYKPALAADGVTPVLQKQLTRHTENCYKLVGTLQQKPKPTAKQLAAVALLGGGERTQNEMEAHGISRAVLDNLCAKGVVECSKVNKSIDLYSSIPLKNEPIRLTAEQQAAFDALLPGLEDAAPHSALLYGVTGSGKTLVFLKLIERCLALGRRALVLVPEISLTPQMILRLKGQFGRRVAVQHSALNHTERLLQWQTAAQCAAARQGLWGFYRALWPAAALGLALMLWSPLVLGKAAGVLWLLTPVFAFLLSLPAAPPPELSPRDRDYLLGCARDTWGYFARVLTAEDHFLPPDNLQVQPPVGIAHRTSPTNIGLGALSVLAAADLGFVSAADAAALIIIPLLFGVFTGILGLVENLRHPSLDWSNEAQAVKTGVGLLFTMLISWATLIPPIILYAVCDVNFNICAWGFAAAIAAADILLYRWLMSRGAEIYAAL